MKQCTKLAFTNLHGVPILTYIEGGATNVGGGRMCLKENESRMDYLEVHKLKR